MKVVLFDIKSFAIGDGPGIRTTVFFKGCPLRCRWCHNPEGLSADVQLCIKTPQCTHCGKCLKKCTHAECQKWGRCLHICPQGNISIAGKEYDSETLASILKRDTDLYLSSGGGVTFSGGEPMMQISFIRELIPKLYGIHTAVETSGYISPDKFINDISLFDYVMFDLKLYDNDSHIEYTGVPNKWIHENLRMLQSSGKKHVLRIPVIPDITDTEHNLRGLAKLAGDSDVELLSYNTLAGAKYTNFGMKYPLEDIRPSVRSVFEFEKYFRHVKSR
ncbi:MAG: glycyl-radical enzyme activating protein [Eubacteriales bacterium]